MIRDASYKLSEMIQSETRLAFAEPTARERGLMTQGAKRGSILGEIARDVGLFKAFPTSFLAQHLLGRARGLGGLEGAKYAAEMVLAMTVVGSIPVQIRNLVKGKDLQDMRDPSFWQQALLQGGGAGILGDFLFSDTNRFGKSLTLTALGPVASVIDDIQKLTQGNLSEYIQGHETHFPVELIKAAHRYAPGQNLFYTRLAMERLIFDRLQEAARPAGAHTSFRRIMQAARKDYGTEFWWKPGEPTPERAPKFGTASGD